MTHDALDSAGWAPSEAVVAAEAAVVGTAITSRAAAEHATELVQPGDLFKSLHRIVFDAVAALVNEGHPVDETAVLKELARRGEAGKVTGGHLLELTRHASRSTLAYHARTVVADAQRRRVLMFAERTLQRAKDAAFTPDADIDLIRKDFEDAVAGAVGDEPPTIGDLLLDILDDLERPLSSEDLLPPPYMDLELLLPGLRPGQLVVIGARPSIGKSLVGMDIARAAAIRLGQPTLMLSLEMSRKELMHRLLAAEASVSLDKFTKHSLADDDWTKIAKVRDRVFEAPLVVDDAPKCTLSRVRARLRGMQSRFGGCRLAVVDYLGLLEAPRADSRERAVAEITRGMKLMAMEFGIPLVLLAQLNRESEHRADRKPQPSDLRESGAIEADADVILLLHREDAHDKESPRAGELDVIVAKNRNGPTGTATVAFQGQYGRAADMYRPR